MNNTKETRPEYNIREYREEQRSRTYSSYKNKLDCSYIQAVVERDLITQGS